MNEEYVETLSYVLLIFTLRMARVLSPVENMVSQTEDSSSVLAMSMNRSLILPVWFKERSLFSENNNFGGLFQEVIFSSDFFILRHRYTPL